MTNPQQTSMNVIEAIYHRRAVRDYLPKKVDEATIRLLLETSVHAPTAMHEEPWSFVVIQDKNLLDRLSDSVKIAVLQEAQINPTSQSEKIFNLVNNPDFHVFYNASTLIVIYAKFKGSFVEADCWLAAENLMLSAVAKELGTCVIGFAVSTLNTPMWKTELAVPSGMTAVAPIIVGYPATEVSPTSRKPVEILTWK